MHYLCSSIRRYLLREKKRRAFLLQLLFLCACAVAAVLGFAVAATGNRTDSLFSFRLRAQVNSSPHRSTGSSSNHTKMSSTPKGSSTPCQSLTFKGTSPSKGFGTSSSKAATLAPSVVPFKDTVALDLEDDVELDGLLGRLTKPSGQTIPLSGNEAAEGLQRGLVLSLQLSYSISVDSIITRANGTFSILEDMDVNFGPLYEKVKTFLKFSALWARVADASGHGPTLEELEADFEEKKIQLDKIANSHGEISSLVNTSKEKIAQLEDEISQAKESLKLLESKLSLSKKEYMLHKDNLSDLTGEVTRSEAEFHVALEVLNHHKKNKTVHLEKAKEALAKAKASLNE